MKKLLLFFCMILSVHSLFSQNRTTEQILTDMHWIIERSHVDTVAAKFAAISRTNHFPSSVTELRDGKYTGESPYDDYNYKHVISFEMKNGKIISLDYDEIHKDGHGKQADTTYCENMNVTGTNPSIAYPIYEKAMLEKQDFNSIDAVSGASYSLYRFKLAVLYAIKNSNQL